MATKMVSDIPSETETVYRLNMFEVMCKDGDFDDKKGTAYYSDSCTHRTPVAVDLDAVKDGEIDRSYKFVHWVD